MQIKSGELTGPALDWAVATLEKLPKDVLVVVDGRPIIHRTFMDEITELRCEFSAHWSQGGPIIEREQIEIRKSGDRWVAMWWADNSGMAKNPAQRFEFNYMTHGPTPLVAAMRAYVASKMGDTVDVPDDLV